MCTPRDRGTRIAVLPLGALALASCGGDGTDAVGVDCASESDSDALVTNTTSTATVVETGQPDVSLTEGSFVTSRFN